MLAAMGTAADDPRFVEGIECFNHRDFFEAHDVWEEIWREEQGPSRRFLQGLIQLAVCLHHFGNGNMRGARKLCLSGSGYLEPYRPAYLGLDLDRLLTDMQVCCRELLASQESNPQGKLDPDMLPTIVVIDTQR